ncbi:hypothetical protein BH23PSE2_BH23PSE2_08400 [soil metagenome]
MARRALGLLACGLIFIASAAAQEAATATSPAWAPRSGSAVLDRRLVDINAYAARYPDAFIDELVRYFHVPRSMATERMVAGRMVPADLYLACAIARVSGRACRSVLDARDRAPEEAWPALAERLGVLPRSPQANQLEQVFVDSYRRWARPLPAPPADARSGPATVTGTKPG